MISRSISAFHRCLICVALFGLLTVAGTAQAAAGHDSGHSPSMPGMDHGTDQGTMPGMDHGTDQETMPGMDHGTDPGMGGDTAPGAHGDDHSGATDHGASGVVADSDRPAGLVIGGFFAVNAALILLASVLRRRGPAARRRLAMARVRAAAGDPSPPS